MIWVIVHQQLRNDQRIHSPASSHPPSRLGRNGESFIKRQELTMKAMKTSETYKNCLKIWKRTTNWIQLDHISSCRRFSDAPELRSAGTCVISPGVRPSWHGFGYWNRECFTSRCVAWSSMVSWCWSSWWLVVAGVPASSKSIWAHYPLRGPGLFHLFAVWHPGGPGNISVLDLSSMTYDLLNRFWLQVVALRCPSLLIWLRYSSGTVKQMKAIRA